MFPNCILFATFCSTGTFVRRWKPWRYSVRKVMEFGQLMVDILVYVSCKFEMYIFEITQVIGENVPIAYLYVLSIVHQLGQTKNTCVFANPTDPISEKNKTYNVLPYQIFHPTLIIFRFASFCYQKVCLVIFSS